MRKPEKTRAKRPGRPQTKRVPTTAQRVACLRAAGFTIEAIAAAVGVPAPVLAREYCRELADGANIARAQIVEAMFGAALDRNSSAAKAYLALTTEPEPPKPEEPEPKRAPWAARRSREEQEALDAIYLPENAHWLKVLGTPK